MTKLPKALTMSAVLTALAVAAGPVALAQASSAPGLGRADQPQAVSALAPAWTGFSPTSVTYVSASQGWVLGTVPCAKNRCLKLLHTSNDGASWSSVPVPPAGPVGNDGVPLRARFADSQNGWNLSTLPGQARVEAWSTHNGGQHWSPLVFAAPKGQGPAGLEDIEAARGTVDAAVQIGDQVEIFSSPVANNGWHLVGGPYQLGAGPVPAGQLTLQGGAGWFVQNDRVVVSGGREQPSGRWASWVPPCAKAGGPLALAAAAPTQVDALCTEGVWTGPKITIDLLRSTDGGAHFGAARLLPMTAADLVAATGSATIAIGADVNGPSTGAVKLEMSFDDGSSWSSVYSHPGDGWAELGFTTSQQGVAIVLGANGGTNTMLFTSDGGRHWAPVAFRS